MLHENPSTPADEAVLFSSCARILLAQWQQSCQQCVDDISASLTVLSLVLQVTAASDVVHSVTALLTEHALQEVQTDRQTAAAFW